MKKTLLSLTSLCFVLGMLPTGITQAQNTSGYVRCSTMDNLQRLKQEDPGLEARMEKIEVDMQTWIANQGKYPKGQSVVVKIPTVVHVVYANAGQNLADTYIQQQIDVLNKDFRKLNTDWNQTPSAFLSLVADCEIEFCLASKDPSGANTNGIIHKSTTVASFSTDDKIKSASTGGSDPWPSAQYLNLWVGNLGGGLLGYAQFPGGPAATDGVVVLYSSLPGPPSAAPYDLGRTATHEVGHWLNLRHINGDANCGNDQVSDTPTQDILHGGCPSPHPYHANVCSGSTQGEMTMNYMDYTDDACMYMFSAGQKTRMQACLSTSRSGLGPAAATKCTVSGISEVLSSDMISIFPNPSTGAVTIGTDLMNITSMDIVVYNAIGEAVVTRKINVPAPGGTVVDLSNNPDGIYLFEVKTSIGTITKKTVINR